MINKTHTVVSDTETQKLGEVFAKELHAGNSVYLYGDLGFGKTTFVKGIAKGLGIESRIISPTFVIVRQHKTKLKSTVYHIDLYRIENEDQMLEVGLQEILSDTSSIKLIEWPEKISGEKPTWEIKFILNNDNVRTININKI